MGAGLVFLVPGRAPVGVGSQGYAWVASPRSCALATANDEPEYVTDGGGNPIVQQEKFFETAGNSVNAIFEIGFNPGFRVVGRLGVAGFGLPGPAWRRGRVEIDVRLVGEEPVHGNENKVSVEFLLHSTIGPGMEVLNDKQLFADFIEFLHSPSGVIDVHQRV